MIGNKQGYRLLSIPFVALNKQRISLMNKLLISQHQRKLLLVALMTLFNGTAQTNDPWSSDRKWLFGDWDENRQQLEQKGYKFNFSVMNQSAVNFDGGYNDDQELLNAYQLTLGANFDLEKY